MSDLGRFSEAIEQQLATYRFVAGGGCSNLISAIVEKNGARWAAVNPYSTQERANAYANSIARAVFEIIAVPLRDGTPYWWDSRLIPMLQDLARTIPDDWTLEESMLPSPFGYLRFASPLPLDEYQGDDGIADEPLTAITWINARMPDDDPQPEQACLTFHTSDAIRRSGDPATVGPWPYGTTLVSQYARGMGETTIRNRSAVLSRWKQKLQYFAAAIAFMNTSIASTHPVQVPRSTRRRLERDKWAHDPVVHVVQLRRRAPHPDGPMSFVEVDWSYQWLVSPHWRNQWYPSEHRYRRILIASYIKGPEDKPLKMSSTRLFAVVR